MSRRNPNLKQQPLDIFFVNNKGEKTNNPLKRKEDQVDTVVAQEPKTQNNLYKSTYTLDLTYSEEETIDEEFIIQPAKKLKSLPNTPIKTSSNLIDVNKQDKDSLASNYDSMYSKLGFSHQLTTTPPKPQNSNASLGKEEVDTQETVFEPTSSSPYKASPSSKSNKEPTSVMFPFDKENTYFCKVLGRTRNKWELIEETLITPIVTSNQLQEAILKYNSHHRGKWDFSTLHQFINSFLAKEFPEELQLLFTKVLPGMQELALSLASLFAEESSTVSQIPLLLPQQQKTLLLSQHQIASLLANAFFCTYPKRNWSGNEYGNFPSINFNTLFGLPTTQVKFQKLRCILHYFTRVVENMPQGYVSFHRRCLQSFPEWQKCSATIGSSELNVYPDGTIEDAKTYKQHRSGVLEVDFANATLGGGVLSNGCVQEEIRFLINTELIVSRLFTSKLTDNECVIITGVERYCNYRGYSDSFEYAGDYQDKTARDNHGRRDTKIVAVDAMYFKTEREQFSRSQILRELNKAYVAFALPKSSQPPSAIATGNWGCGAFKGNPRLKAILQLIVSTEVGRPLEYYTWGDKTLAGDIKKCYTTLSAMSVTVGDLFKALLNFCSQYSGETSSPEKEHLLRWLEEYFLSTLE